MSQYEIIEWMYDNENENGSKEIWYSSKEISQGVAKKFNISEKAVSIRLSQLVFHSLLKKKRGNIINGYIYTLTDIGRNAANVTKIRKGY